MDGPWTFFGVNKKAASFPRLGGREVFSHANTGAVPDLIVGRTSGSEADQIIWFFPLINRCPNYFHWLIIIFFEID